LDGHHQTRPSREGEEFVMREALRRSNVEPRDIDLVSAHATGTPLGDETEAAAIGSVLGAKAEGPWRSEEHTSELQSRFDLVCRLLLEKKYLTKMSKQYSEFVSTTKRSHSNLLNN